MFETFSRDKYQVVLFPHDFFRSDLQPLVTAITALEQFRDSNVIQIPLPSEAPRNIPRVIIEKKTDKRTLKLELSFDAFSFFWISQDGHNIEVNLSEMTALISRVVEILIPGSTIKRIGYIEGFIKPSSDLAADISTKVIKSEIIHDLRDFNVQLTYNIRISTFGTCNKVISLTSASKANAPKERLIYVQSDINTKPDRDAGLTNAHIVTFIENASEINDPTSIYREFVTNDETISGH